MHFCLEIYNPNSGREAGTFQLESRGVSGEFLDVHPLSPRGHTAQLLVGVSLDC